MSAKTLSKGQEIGLQINKLNAEVSAIHDEVGDGTPSQEQFDLVVAKNKEIERLEAEFAKTETWHKSREAVDSRQQIAEDHLAGLHPNTQRQVLAALGKSKSAGHEFVESDLFQEWLAELKTGETLRSGNFRSPNVPVSNLITGASATSAGALVINDRKPIVDPGVFYREVTMLDVVGYGTTDSDTVEYAREKSHTNNADTRAEATATGGSSGTAQESTMVLEEVTESVRNIAHWVPVTRRAIADAGQMRAIIDNFLREGLRQKLEDKIVAGSGTNDIAGVINVSGVTAQAYDSDILTTARKGRTKVKTTGRAKATAYCMHPNDWQAFDLLQDNEARYFFGGPSILGTPRMWGLPVVESESFTEGQGMVAAWNLSILFDRQQTTIYTTDSHSDNFVRNIMVVLAELRAAFAVLRPAAFVTLDFTA